MRSFLAALLMAPLPVTALELELTGFYELNNPASLDYDPTFCGLWIANEGPEVILVTLDGLELQRFGSDLFRIKAVTVEGNHLLVGDGFSRLQRLSKTGEPLGAPFETDALTPDIEGIAIAEDGNLITVEDDPARISWMTPDGQVIRQIDAMLFDPPITEPQGIARDPRNGHLLIVDDWEGTNALHEFDKDGVHLGSTPLIQYGRDPEGIALRPGSGQLFIAFDQGRRIAGFDYTPTLTGDETPLPPSAECIIS